MHVSALSPRRLAAVLATSASLFASAAWADLELPAPSPAAKVSQRVGITDISLEYSSPAVNGRKIFGGLLKWETPWRTGANAATKITFSRDVTFGDKAVPAGTYSVVSIPSEKNWIVALNKDLGISIGDGKYDAKDELVRVKASVSSIPARERMLFVFGNTKEDGTSLDLEWDTKRVSVPVKIDTAKYVDASIKATLDAGWKPYANSATYVADHSKDYATAIKFVDQSIGLQSTWRNNWIKADILHRQGKNAEAIPFAKTALELGDKEPATFWYRDQVVKALAEWK